MKHPGIRLFCFLFLCLMLIPHALAHPGRTDAAGGHRDKNNVSGFGGYHYHHGYSAHLHPDGVCPYDFDDRTGQQGGGSSSKTDGEDERPASSSAATTAPNPSPAPSARRSPFTTPQAFAFAAILMGVVAICMGVQRKRYFALYARKSISALAGVPDGYTMDPKGTLYHAGKALRREELLEVYVTERGRAYHSSRCAYAEHGHRIKLSAARQRGLRPCNICRPGGELPSWFAAYRQINARRKWYRIPMDP